MNEWQYWKAKGTIQKGWIRMVHASPETGNFQFEIEGNIIVSKNFKGWQCDAVCVRPDGKKWSCTFDKKGKCWHILSARMLLDVLSGSREVLRHVDSPRHEQSSSRESSNIKFSHAPSVVPFHKKGDCEVCDFMRSKS